MYTLQTKLTAREYRHPNEFFEDMFLVRHTIISTNSSSTCSSNCGCGSLYDY